MPSRPESRQIQSEETAISRVLPLFFQNAQRAAAANLPREEEIWLRAILILDADNFEGNVALINSLLRREPGTEVIALATQLVDKNPDSALALWQLGLTLQFADRHPEAIPFYRCAYNIDAAVPTLRNNLAVALEATGFESEAYSLWCEAVLIDSRDTEAWINLCRVHLRRFDLEAAIHAGERATFLSPSNALALSNYSLVLKEAQRWDDATLAAQAAITADPKADRYQFNLSILDLVQGNYSRGWAGFETRWHGSSELRDAYPAFNAPRWSGESLHNKTLLLWGEQGFGDAIQFCRFVVPLAEQVESQGGKLVWTAFRALHPTMRRLAPANVECIPNNAPLPAFDFQLPLMSLPLAFDVNDDAIPATQAYLSADPERGARWREALASEKRLRVGLVWSGSLTHQRNPFRAVGIDRYVDAFGALDKIAFYSLQKGAELDVAAAHARGFSIMDHTSEFESFEDTAAFIESLDLVITVCTSVAHLAAALGKPTWILLDVNPHWVWQLERRDSPWYPTVTLYRQTRFGQWDPLLGELRRDLGRLAPNGNISSFE
jgi:tetratricopeptide (TPR) repeat protein